MFSGLNSVPWRRLNVRLAIWHSGIAFATSLAVLLLTYFALRTRVVEQDHDVVLFRLNQYSAEYRRSGLDGVIALAALRKGRVQKAFFVRVASAENRTLFERDAEDWAEFDSGRLEREGAPSGEGIEWLSLPSPEGYELLLAGLRLSDGTIVQVGKATEESFTLLKQFRFITLVMLLVSIPASFAGGVFLAARARCARCGR